MVLVEDLELTLDEILSDEKINFSQAMLLVSRFLPRLPDKQQYEFILDLQHAYSWNLEDRES